MKTDLHLDPDEGLDPWAMEMLERMSFPPTLKVDVTGEGQVRLTVDFMWGDVREMAPGTVNDRVRLAQMWQIPTSILLEQREEAFFLFVRNCVCMAFVHEADEWLKVDGDARWNPHRDTYDHPINPMRGVMY